MPGQSPVNPLPASVVALAVVIFGVEVMFSMAQQGFLGGPGGIGWRTEALKNYAFFGEAVDWMVQNRRFPPELLARFVTYPLLHVNFTHALFVCVFILAIGKMVGEAFGQVAVGHDAGASEAIDRLFRRCAFLGVVRGDPDFA